MTSRRTFLVTLAGGIIVAPLAAEPQQAGKITRIGFLPVDPSSDPITLGLIDAFRQGLREIGRVENRDFVLDIVWVSSEAKAAEAAATSIRRRPILLVTVGSTMSVAVKRQTSTIPFSSSMSATPSVSVLVESLSHPNSNATGFSDVLGDLSGKHVDLAREVATTVGYLWHTGWPDGQRRYLATERAARSLGVTLRSRGIGDADEVIDAITAIKKAGAILLVIQASPFMWRLRHRLIESAMNHGLATIFGWPRLAMEGALIGYGPDAVDLYRRAASYADRILNGTNPADLPVQEPTKFLLLINLKTAKALGLAIPQTLLLRADQVIQ